MQKLPPIGSFVIASSWTEVFDNKWDEIDFLGQERPALVVEYVGPSGGSSPPPPYSYVKVLTHGGAIGFVYVPHIISADYEL